MHGQQNIKTPLQVQFGHYTNQFGNSLLPFCYVFHINIIIRAVTTVF